MKKDDKVSPYQILNKWLYDGSSTSIIPKEILEGNIIGPQYILWYFKNSIYNIYINKHFNNFDIYKLDKKIALQFLKKAIIDTGFKPKFIPKQKHISTKISKLLKNKYPYFKSDDINLLVSIIDKSEEKDQIYETFGLYQPKKKKTTKAVKKEILDFFESNPQQEKKSSDDSFLSGFTIEGIDI